MSLEINIVLSSSTQYISYIHYLGYIEAVIPLSSGISPDDIDHMLVNLRYDKIFGTTKAYDYLIRQNYEKRDYILRCIFSYPKRVRKYISPNLLCTDSFSIRTIDKLNNNYDNKIHIKNKERLLRLLIKRFKDENKSDELINLLLDEYLNSLYVC